MRFFLSHIVGLVVAETQSVIIVAGSALYTNSAKVFPIYCLECSTTKQAKQGEPGGLNKNRCAIQ